MAFSLLGRSIARDRQLDPIRLTTLPLLIGGVLSFFLAILVEGIPHLSEASIFIVFWLAVINTALGYLLYNHALQELTALEVNMILNLSPFFTALLGWLFLGERIALIQLAGMLIMITGVIVVQWTFRSNPEVN
jgi:drug/metabolite transporter (DMT)-like permease